MCGQKTPHLLSSRESCPCLMQISNGELYVLETTFPGDFGWITLEGSTNPSGVYQRQIIMDFSLRSKGRSITIGNYQRNDLGILCYLGKSTSKFRSSSFREALLP